MSRSLRCNSVSVSSSTFRVSLINLAKRLSSGEDLCTINSINYRRNKTQGASYLQIRQRLLSGGASYRIKALCSAAQIAYQPVSRQAFRPRRRQPPDLPLRQILLIFAAHLEEMCQTSSQ